jgi:hypothetical protein
MLNSQPGSGLFLPLTTPLASQRSQRKNSPDPFALSHDQGPDLRTGRHNFDFIQAH